MSSGYQEHPHYVTTYYTSVLFNDAVFSAVVILTCFVYVLVLFSMGVLVICVLVFTVFCIVCTVFLYCSVYVYYLFCLY